MLLKIKNLACARTGGSDDALALEKKKQQQGRSCHVAAHGGRASLRGRATWRLTVRKASGSGSRPVRSPDRTPSRNRSLRDEIPPLLILHLHPSPPSPSRALGGTDGGGRPSCLSGRGRWARRARRCRVGRPSGQVGHALPAPGGALTRACGPGVLVVLVLVVLRRPSLSIKRRGGTKNICAL
jgi:hypothetical protein